MVNARALARRVPRFARYVAVGGVGTGAQYLVLVGAVALHAAAPVAASVAGAFVGALVNYLLNRRFTFRTDTQHRSALPKFFATAGAGMLVNGVAMAWLTGFLHLHYLVAQCIASAAVLVLTFSVNSVWTFGARRASVDY